MADHEIKPPPHFLRRLILQDFKEPMVFKGFISDWKILTWGLEDWASKLNDKLMPFRCGVRKKTAVPQWERNCQMRHLTMREFLELAEQNGANANNKSSNWFYFDYKYMKDWFKDNPEILHDVHWNTFGFSEVGGEQSTVWIGSDCAHTPCHFDTYGCNLVAQVYGMKQWILFPPKDSETLLPTRVPYEESSVYSKRNFFSPDGHLASDLDKAWVITLKPGEVLLVPRHWWHYVENVGTAISINTWLPLPSDKDSRVEESLVRLLVSQLLKEVPHAEILFNPNEDDTRSCPLQDSATLLETCIQQTCEHHLEMEQSHSEGKSPDHKRMKTAPNDTNSFADDVMNIASLYKNYIQNVPTYSGDKLQCLLSLKEARFQPSVHNDTETSPLRFTMEKVINALCHPDVVCVVKEKLYQEFCGNHS